MNTGADILRSVRYKSPGRPEEHKEQQQQRSFLPADFLLLTLKRPPSDAGHSAGDPRGGRGGGGRGRSGEHDDTVVNNCSPLQDPLDTLREKCEKTDHCVHYKERLESCEAGCA
ncbi:hypothetical protein CRUP_021003 [Coryphaenoides rupestris]|nr:hypothetical protein CRUP_021003 [Coryphaenoides rupestris]